jgi:uncharacterized protein (PEP-CTERM system associated)
LLYEHGTEPSSGSGEVFDRLGPSLGVSYNLMERLSTALAYRYTRRMSNLPDRDYSQNSVTLTITYHF